VLEVGNPGGGKQAVLEGCGLVILPRRVVAAELADGRRVALACPDIPPVEQFYLIYRQTHRFSPLAQELMTYLRAELSEPKGQ
jgi:DNA-binding transcriptional LysR family regulator